MTIINNQNFIKFSIRDDGAFIIYNEYEKITLPDMTFTLVNNNNIVEHKITLLDIIILADHFFFRNYFSINDGKINSNIPLVLFFLQIEMNQEQKRIWSFDTESRTIESEGEKSDIVKNHFASKSKGEINNSHCYKNKVLRIVPIDSLDNVFYPYDITIDEMRNLYVLFITKDASFAVSKELIIEFYNLLGEETGIDVELDDVMDFGNRLIKYGLSLYVDHLTYKQGGVPYTYMSYSFKIPDMENMGIYCLTDKKTPLHYDVELLNSAMKICKVIRSLELTKTSILDEETISSISQINAQVDLLCEKIEKSLNT